MREPAFWWRKPGLAAALLTPLGAVYGAVAARRLARRGARAGVPIICVGNFTLGGAGKTPTAMLVARLLAEAGERVFCLSRGYGGSQAGPKLVAAHADHAAQVGDEALLLARAAPTIVARDRVAGAALRQSARRERRGHGRRLAERLARQGFHAGGGRRKDAASAMRGCSRPAPCARRWPRNSSAATRCWWWATATARGASSWRRRRAGCRCCMAGSRPTPTRWRRLQGRKVLAFAGIGDPEKFFASARAAGIEVAQTVAFPDHHRFTAEEAAELIMDAEHDGLALLTTEKDHARMAGDTLLGALAARAHVLPVTMEIDEREALRVMVMGSLRR